MKPTLVLAALALVLCHTGCESTSRTTRIQEKSATFASLTAAQQTQIQNGGVEPGYTPDMVYMALGKPTKIITAADGKETTWVYNNYYLPDDTYNPIGKLTRNGAPGSIRNKTSFEAPNVRPGASGPLSSTAPNGFEPSMEIPDMPTETLFITFRDNGVVDMRLGD